MAFLSYNNTMVEKRTENKIRLSLKILLPVLCALWLGFIFSNSLKTGEESSAQSSTVVEVVQTVVQAVAPKSELAQATGEAYDKLHAFVRSMAHFTEFAVLGALFAWCYFSYTFRFKHCYLPFVGIVVVPLIDELLQKFTAARACTLIDVVVDVAGGVVGLAFATLTVWLGVKIYQRIKKSKQNQAPMCEMNQE